MAILGLGISGLLFAWFFPDVVIGTFCIYNLEPLSIKLNSLIKELTELQNRITPEYKPDIEKVALVPMLSISNYKLKYIILIISAVIIIITNQLNKIPEFSQIVMSCISTSLLISLGFIVWKVSHICDNIINMLQHVSNIITLMLTHVKVSDNSALELCDIMEHFSTIVEEVRDIKSYRNINIITTIIIAIIWILDIL